MYLKDKWWTSSFGIICKIFIENFQTNEFSTQEKKFEVSENQTETKEFSQIYLFLFLRLPYIEFIKLVASLRFFDIFLHKI